jgi:hypothetical protein
MRYAALHRILYLRQKLDELIRLLPCNRLAAEVVPGSERKTVGLVLESPGYFPVVLGEIVMEKHAWLAGLRGVGDEIGSVVQGKNSIEEIVFDQQIIESTVKEGFPFKIGNDVLIFNMEIIVQAQGGRHRVYSPHNQPTERIPRLWTPPLHRALQLSGNMESSPRSLGDGYDFPMDIQLSTEQQAVDKCLTDRGLKPGKPKDGGDVWLVHYQDEEGTLVPIHYYKDGEWGESHWAGVGYFPPGKVNEIRTCLDKLPGRKTKAVIAP